MSSRDLSAAQTLKSRSPIGFASHPERMHSLYQNKPNVSTREKDAGKLRFAYGTSRAAMLGEISVRHKCRNLDN